MNGFSVELLLYFRAQQGPTSAHTTASRFWQLLLFLLSEYVFRESRFSVVLSGWQVKCKASAGSSLFELCWAAAFTRNTSLNVVAKVQKNHPSRKRWVEKISPFTLFNLRHKKPLLCNNSALFPDAQSLAEIGYSDGWRRGPLIYYTSHPPSLFPPKRSR